MPRRFSAEHLFSQFAVCLGLFLAAPLLSHPAQAQPEAPAVTESFSEAFQLYVDDFYAEAAGEFAAFRARHPEHPDATNALYYEALSTLRLGHPREAAQLFQQFEQQYPGHRLAGRAQFTLGRYLYEQGQYQQSLTYFERLLETDPSPERTAETLYKMGQAALQLGQYEKAIEHLQNLVDEHASSPYVPEALLALGRAHMRREEYQEAAETFEHLRGQYPDAAGGERVDLQLAEAYYQMGDYRRAVDVLSDLSSFPRDVQERAALLLAESYQQLRNRPQAVEAYRRFITRYPKSPHFQHAAYQLAWNLYQQRRFEQAAQAFERVHRDASNELARQALYYEAISRRQADQPEAAIGLFHQIINAGAEDIWAQRATFELGATLYEQQQWDEANRFLTTYVERYPDAERRSEALQLRGRTDIERGSLNNAMRSFDEAASLDDASPSVRRKVGFQQGWLLYQQGKNSEAESRFMAIQEEFPESEEGAEALFWAAELAFQQDQFRQAADRYAQYLRRYPDGDRTDAARYALAWSHFKQRQYEQAARGFERFVANYEPSAGSVPYQSDALLRLGDSYYALKRYDEALQAYARVSGTGTEYALYQTGMANYRKGDYEDALRAFRALRSNYPNSDWSEEALHRVGYMQLQQQNYEAAISAYESLLEERPSVQLAAQAQYGIGDAHFNAGRMEQAISAYKEVLQRYPRSPLAGEAASSIQYALISLGEEDRMDEIINEFVEQNPDSPVVDELRFRRAEVKYQSGQTDEALAAFQQFVRSSESERLLPEAYYYLGSIYAEREQQQEARSYLQQLVSNYPDSPRRLDAARQLGRIYIEQGDHERALSVYEQLEETQPDDLQLLAQARYGQSQALLEMGRLDEAEQLLQEVVDRAPQDPATVTARLGLARIYEQQGQIQRAVQAYRTVVERGSGETGAEALYRLGALQLQQGNPADAVQTLSRLPTLFPGSGEWLARSYLAQARAFRQMNQTGDATRMYDQVINQFSGTSYAQTARTEKEALQ